MASSLEIVGIEKSENVRFNSVMGLARGERAESSYDPIYGCYMDLQRMIRKDGFKLIVYHEADKTLLFDLENDPLEINDLSDNPDYEDVRNELFIHLLNLQMEMNDELELENN